MTARLRNGNQYTPRPYRAGQLIDRIDGTSREQAARLGVTPRQLARYKHNYLTAVAADELAARVGLHPCEVWGDLWWTHAEQETA